MKRREDAGFELMGCKLPYRVWLAPPGMLMLAIGLAGAHHSYYSFLSNQIVGSPSRQQWSIRIGTGLAWTVVALLKATAGFAYTQLLFWLLRKKAIPMQDIDALFDLRKADPSAFLTKCIWRKAILLLPFALIIITLPIAAVFPPATLSTMSTIGPQQILPSLNWTTQSSKCTWDTDYNCDSLNMHSTVGEVLLGGSILDFYQPAPDTSYRLTFEGPSMSCATPNSTQQLAFEYYAKTKALANQIYIASTSDIVNSSNFSIGYYSSFFLGLLGTGPLVDLGNSYEQGYGYGSTKIKSATTYQYWVQLFDENLVCTLVSADFDVSITFDVGHQVVKYNNFTLKEAIFWSGNITQDDANSGPFSILSDTLSGNMTLLVINGIVQRVSGWEPPPLSVNTCIASTLDSIQRHLPNITISEEVLGQVRLGRTPDTLLQSCPTGTLSGNLMEMMNNVTISTISSDNVAIKNLTIVATAGNLIIYNYNSRDLIASYGVAILVVSIVFVAGLFAISNNGMVHDSSFSAMVAVTRNPRLDVMFADENISGYPLTAPFCKQKLRFGALRSTCQCNGRIDSHEKEHCSMVIAFGTEDEIAPIQLKDMKRSVTGYVQDAQAGLRK